ncbi:sulfite exporter TauE/SafE family protein [Acinetobacter corruptisaponis]|uniref:Probable membrane transporter protein n=1 Tax=Acinetobacter corruptisaponis TaxID=3045147 RepID=A0ABY8RZL2_9GAMM|nr:sulfite exporter TauE/SafE family protein [Acinetobacter sp. KCTC 92772]WHP04406.1 sulfite exporter TauE/SafE family protein [Acinetobacter sp. KCTC 92772]
MWLLVLEGLAIGCLLGMTGAGGGILAVPALMASQGWTVAQAAPVGLLAVTLSAMVGTVQGLYKRIVRYRAAIWIAIISIPSARYGVHLSGILPATWLSVAFSLIMFIVAYRVFANQVDDFVDPPCKVNPSTGRLIWDMKTASILGSIGILAGLLTGLLGVGGGFVIVPALRKVSDLDMHSIVATSLLIICLIGGFSILIHVLDGFHYPVDISLGFVSACIIGMLIGRKAIGLISVKTVQKIFALTVFCVANYILFKAIF